jgi:hypothetical protein
MGHRITEEQYLKLISNDDTPTSRAEIYAMSHLYQRTIIVARAANGVMLPLANSEIYGAEFQRPDNPPIVLVHTGHHFNLMLYSHYELLRHIQ